MERASAEGLLEPGSDPGVLIDKTFDAVPYRAIQPDPLSATEARR